MNLRDIKTQFTKASLQNQLIVKRGKLTKIWGTPIQTREYYDDAHTLLIKEKATMLYSMNVKIYILYKFNIVGKLNMKYLVKYLHPKYRQSKANAILSSF